MRKMLTIHNAYTCNGCGEEMPKSAVVSQRKAELLERDGYCCGKCASCSLGEKKGKDAKISVFDRLLSWFRRRDKQEKR